MDIKKFMFDNDFSVSSFEIPDENKIIDPEKPKQIADELKLKIEKEILNSNDKNNNSQEDDILWNEIIGSKIETSIMDDPDSRPIYSQIQLDEAIRDAGLRAKDEIIRAKKEGIEEGRQQVKQNFEENTLVLLKNIAENIENIKNTQDKIFDSVKDEMLLVCIEIIKKILPIYAEKHGTNEILDLIKQNIPLLYQEPKLIIKINETIKDKIEPKIKDIMIKNAHRGELIIIGDNALDEFSCSIDWAKGGLEKNTTKFLESIKQKNNIIQTTDGE